MIHINDNLYRLSKNELFDLAEFVVMENFKHHCNSNFSDSLLADIISISEEEKLFFNNSQIFVSKTKDGEIEGTIRVLKWNYIDKLPIQTIFGINPLNIVGFLSNKSIWHIGRFAIKKECKSLNTFKKLMTCAIAPICENKNAVAFAECDSKLLRVLRILGIKATQIGEGINYLGSETIPICMDYQGLINFYNQNKHLVSSQIIKDYKTKQKLHKRVVFEVIS